MNDFTRLSAPDFVLILSGISEENYTSIRPSVNTSKRHQRHCFIVLKNRILLRVNKRILNRRSLDFSQSDPVLAPRPS